MMKKLRFLFVAFMAMVGLSATAQEVTFDFTPVDNPWGLPTANMKDEGSFTNGTYTIKLAAPDAYKLSDVKENNEVVSKYLLIGKQGATFTFPAFTFDVEKIEIVGRTGASTAVKQNIFVGEDAVSTETSGAAGTNTYLIKKEYQAAGNVYVLKVTSKHNTQITQIKIYKASGVTAPEISGDEVFCGSTQVTITADEGAQIYYTTDGNDPTTSDALYAGPFTLTSSATVKAVAAKSGALSSVVSKDFIMTTGDGSETNPFTVADVLSLPAAYTGTGKWVKGVIVGSVKNAGALEETPETASNIAIADAAGETDWAKISCVALPAESEIRTALNLVDNPTNIGQEVKVCGSIEKYFGNMGVKSPTAFALGTSGVNGITADKAIDANAPMYNLAGQRVSKAYKGVVIQNGHKFIVK
ncbi:MAG: chitobiase/beta-hexosaminidase C-terminal domain-containing protein [Prevotella sp.]|nr:chitobiase/beta-hexosaminidase C-terminal domain-containing protein [Prevotella sp.]